MRWDKAFKERILAPELSTGEWKSQKKQLGPEFS